jgi:hypothetical protein
MQSTSDALYAFNKHLLDDYYAIGTVWEMKKKIGEK